MIFGKLPKNTISKNYRIMNTRLSCANELVQNVSLFLRVASHYGFKRMIQCDLKWTSGESRFSCVRNNHWGSASYIIYTVTFIFLVKSMTCELVSPLVRSSICHIECSKMWTAVCYIVSWFRPLLDLPFATLNVVKCGLLFGTS